jgi:hypothetical protein
MQFDSVFSLNPEAISVKVGRNLRQILPMLRLFFMYRILLKTEKASWNCFLILIVSLHLIEQMLKNLILKLGLLFYTDLYKSWKTEKLKYDFLFVGTAHTDRYNYMTNIVSQISEFKVKLYFFLSNKLLFGAKKIFDEDIRNVNYKNVSFIALTHKSNSDLVHRSKIILDINHHKQSGLSMRTS